MTKPDYRLIVLYLKTLFISLFIFSSVSGCATVKNETGLSSIKTSSTQSYREGVVVVKFDETIDTQEAASDVLSSYDLNLDRYNNALRLGVVSVPKGQERDVQAQLETDSQFEYVELDYEYVLF